MADMGPMPPGPGLGGYRRRQDERVAGQPIRREVTEQKEVGGVFRDDHVTNQGLFAPSGDVILTAEQVAGWCALCLAEGRRQPVSTEHAARCERCGRLLCVGHQRRTVETDQGEQREVVYCPSHALRFSHLVIGCLVTGGGLLFLLSLLLRGCH